MPERPAIPSHIVRQILIESGHRCAVCGAGCPLERAHIIPWHISKEHRGEDLICLCASCHERADLEEWGEKTLREYKQRPWILRNFERTETAPEPPATVEITLNLELTQFDDVQQRLFQYAIAAFLNIPPHDVRMISIKKSNSIMVTMEIPSSDARRLVIAYKACNPEIQEYFAPFSSIEVREVRNQSPQVKFKEEIKRMSTTDTSLRIPDDFNQWLKHSRRDWPIPSIGVITPIILAILIHFQPSLLAGIWLPVYLLGFQALVITIFLSLIPPPLSDVEFTKQPSIAIEQFHRAWQWLWFFWILLYIGLAAQELWLISLKQGQLPVPLAEFLKTADKSELKNYQIKFDEFRKVYWPWSVGLITTNLLNNLQTLALVMCYLVVSKKTVNLKRAKALLPWLQAAGILITITAAEVLLTFVLRISGEESFVAVPKAFGWLSGLGAGVAMALFLGRLDSKLIGLPIWIVVFIYLYAVIQPGWIAFPEQPNAKILLVIAALILKTLLFLLVAWLLKSGVLLFYLERLGELEEETKGQRREFLLQLQSSK